MNKTIKPSPELQTNLVSYLLPSSWSNRLIILALVTLALISHFAPTGEAPVNTQAREPMVRLSDYEKSMIKTFVRRGKTEAEATALVIAARPTAEELRRQRNSREEREQQIQSMRDEVCAQQSWLDRCN